MDTNGSSAFETIFKENAKEIREAKKNIIIPFLSKADRMSKVEIDKTIQEWTEYLEKQAKKEHKKMGTNI